MVQTLDKDNLSEETFENGSLKCFKCQSNEKLMKKTVMFNCPPVLMFQIQRIVVIFCCFYFNFYVKGYLRSYFNFQFFLNIFYSPKFLLYLKILMVMYSNLIQSMRLFILIRRQEKVSLKEQTLLNLVLI